MSHRSLVKPDKQTGEGRFFSHPIRPCRYIAQLCQEMLDELKGELCVIAAYVRACLLVCLSMPQIWRASLTTRRRA